MSAEPPTQPQAARPQPPAWPQQHTRPQTWPEPPTVPEQQAQPAAWPQQPPAWPQQAPPPPQQPPAWPQSPPRQAQARQGQAPPGRGTPGQERYAIRQRPQEQYWQHYAHGQQAQEWTPLPLPGQAAQPMTVAPKSPGVSVLLSVFIPGLGSMVNDNAGTGAAILILNIVGWLFAIFLIGIPLAIGTWIWGLVDAYKSAQRWNRAHGIIR